jgi:mannitol-1-phosphate/altronate dehydrogenase
MMNERIHKLAEDSGMTQYVAADNKYLERFTEMVVQDCVAEVAMMGITNFENQDIAWAVDVIIKNIKNKFGDE